MNRVRVPSGRHYVRALAVVAAVVLIFAGTRVAGQIARTGWTVVAWNNLGMHCMDADFSVFAILPPYNTIQAQVLDASGRLVKDGSGITVTYEAVADPAGSINRTSGPIGPSLLPKTNFWVYVQSLFGPGAAGLPVDTGLPPVGFVPAKVQQRMPGTANTPQPMQFDPAFDWYIAEGIPITPYDDAGRKNYYPMMRVTARNGSTLLATTDIVLPVSDEMDCSACHRSGSTAPSGFPSAQPLQGWVNDTSSVQRDFRLNILRLHDEKNGTALFASASANKPVLCASCHISEALGGGAPNGIPPLTEAMHAKHSTVGDPTNGLALGESTNRSACYRCHPGSETRCLRGTMGNAVAVDGTMAIQCQNCHGGMSAVGASTRTGWFQEPACQNCHTGTATSNDGQIRYLSAGAYDAQKQWVLREPANRTFATSADAPVAGVSLYRFSSGHGGLQCSACHGSTHAEYPSAHPNDNVQSVALQGHVGTIGECGTCHTAGVPTLTLGGPHGMHPVGAGWVSGHHDAVSANRAQCQACHGADYRGTVLSRTFAARTFNTELGTKQLFRGAQVGCYMCHNGPSSSTRTSNQPPVASNVSASTTAGARVAISLNVTDPDGNALALRIVSQPANGTVGLSGTTATYFPYAGFSGTDTFTYAAWDGSIDSNLGTVTVTVAPGASCTITAAGSAPTAATVNTAVAFSGSATTANCAGTVGYDWNFGDGSARATSQNPSHAYATAGTFQWALTATIGGVASTTRGSIVVSASTPSCTLTTTATVPTTGVVGTAVSFSSTATPTNCTGSVAYNWNFGDGATAATRDATHAYSAAGNYAWRLTASVGAVTSTRTGSVAISTTQTGAPTITSVRQLSEPFRIQINGTNFQAGVRVYIGGTQWPTVTRNSSQQLTLHGTGLSQQFPRGQTVTIKVVNPDGRFATTTYRRGQ